MSALRTIKSIFKKLLKRPSMWSGDYKAWDHAKSLTKGYDENGILEKVRDATLKVKSGEAAYERDSVIFEKIEYSWPLLAALLWAGCRNKNSLHVLDFGGSLGSSYFQNRKFLEVLHQLLWSVVEQPNFVQTGKKYVETDCLFFHNSIEETINEKGKPDLLLISCTLPYLEKPYELLQQLITYDIPYLVIDNTPFNYKSGDRLTIQKVNPSIYMASYPCWFLDYQQILNIVKTKYRIVEEYQNELSIELDGRPVHYKGFLGILK
jgi:putative methyltransferase (TIGR04325 family)